MKLSEIVKENNDAPRQFSDKTFEQYLNTILWSEHDNSDESGGEPLDSNYSIDDFSEEALRQAREDLNAFFNAVRGFKKLNVHDPQIAHDFWLTRNHHGAGFWDGDYGDKLGKQLTHLAQSFREQHAYVGDDGKIYLE